MLAAKMVTPSLGYRRRGTHTESRVISDNHALFDESLPSIFEGVAAILHAGDICALKVIDPLEKIAPVFAVEGDNDKFGKFPVERIEELAGRRLWFVTFLESCISFV